MINLSALLQQQLSKPSQQRTYYRVQMLQIYPLRRLFYRYQKEEFYLIRRLPIQQYPRVTYDDNDRCPSIVTVCSQSERGVRGFSSENIY